MSMSRTKALMIFVGAVILFLLSTVDNISPSLFCDSAV